VSYGGETANCEVTSTRTWRVAIFLRSRVYWKASIKRPGGELFTSLFCTQPESAVGNNGTDMRENIPSVGVSQWRNQMGRKAGRLSRRGSRQ
jgi:hypothetical protein